MRAPAALWFTGLPGSGKTTLAVRMAHLLGSVGWATEVLDGDEVRRELSPELGFGRTDRDLNVHRIGVLGTLLQKHNVVPLFAVVSPYEASRARAIASLQGCLLVHTTCSMESLLARDPKGLYAKALRGEIPHFTGISDPYEVPEHPDLELHTDRETVDQSVVRIVARLAEAGALSEAEAVHLRAQVGRPSH